VSKEREPRATAVRSVEPPCPLEEEALSPLPASFLELDGVGTMLHVKACPREGEVPRVGGMLGGNLFRDLLRPPARERIRAGYRAMVSGKADLRFLAVVGFRHQGRDRQVEFVFTYYPSGGLGCVHVREVE
jgi:hypothetical protein